MSLAWLHSFSFWSFEISEGILNTNNKMIGLGSFSQQVLNIWGQFRLISVFESTAMLNCQKIQFLFWLFLPGKYISLIAKTAI